ncbi:non-hydrolyzing UDP-N-acetylglucosamine 2-epimerase [Ramlibacter albus]|uniref:UDP-N-acetylglucosamine 2-epimerase (non-hydrolyzing) n=1 Tax=Ramlibacter albus TaxID=2079448 RepID=A0A923MAM5_9BURK|nr:UDP-N-acetylglucosamine 2-epimerase (non-hydrolyzing) [Ramlibacter albus]MBC5766923.1 UDP-N-acetylglucosamine 2-epimerase (non-hydrolyzing) [Ramlibacter albus]
MSRRKILLAFGTRPEAIKMAPVYLALRERTDTIETVLCTTSQHRQMLDQVLDLFAMSPDVDLNVMREGQDLYDVTSAVLLGMRDVLRARRPDIVLVHGDTTTTLAASMAAFYAGIPIGHVEAGLRTHDVRAPFPEEFNRQATSRISSWHFAPTSEARDNLLAEGVAPAAIEVTGNTVIDALLLTLQRIEATPELAGQLGAELGALLPFDWRSRRYVLITGHRRENFGAGFRAIVSAIESLSRRHPDVHFVYPVHLNPNVQQPVREVLSGLPNVHLIPPLAYAPFVLLLKHCHLVLTDSGGIQEEAPSLGKPVLVMRNVTERPEAVAAGTVQLVGSSAERISASVSALVDDADAYRRMSRAHNPYGDGLAASRIVRKLESL